MLFNSYLFIFIFLPLTFSVFFFLGKQGKMQLGIFWLVLASVWFYGWWDVRYVPLLLLSILFNYLIGGKIERKENSKLWLYVGVITDLAVLAFFKYMDFFLTTVNDVLGSRYELFHIVLPLGISFFTFTQIAYLVDAYRGDARNRSFLTYCEFVTIFPHLIAGPIINHKDMIPQFMSPNTFRINYRNIAVGLTLFIMGLFKKVVVADALSPWVSEVFSCTDELQFVVAWIGALAYTFQLYFDFSGYSEMAMGLGLMFNLVLPVNFNSPYQARSIIEFWRRWHMTLGSWVKYYLYIPMGGNRLGEFKKMRNLFVSMLLIGLWHGAGWTFVIWGGIHGLLLMVNHQWRRLHVALPMSVCWGGTFGCVVVAWVFFRAPTVSAAIDILSAMTDIVGLFHAVQNGSVMSAEGWSRLGILAGIMALVLVVRNPVVMIKTYKPDWRWLTAMLILIVWALYRMNSYTEFLYFQF